MTKYIFFTKSMWDEPPRLRHQLANLLVNNNNEVIFFQKPCFFWQKKICSLNSAGISINLLQSKQLIHHQLRLNKFFCFFNEWLELASIKKLLSLSDLENSVVINFNYDYIFLRKIFPKNKIITIINDDFISQAKFKNGAHVKFALSKTCKMSDAVLTVSYPLMKQLMPWSKPLLFLPWTDSAYCPPNAAQIRDSVLIWASINDIIDYDLLENIAIELPCIKFLLVGPISGGAKKIVPDLCLNNKNITYSSPTDLDLLPLNRIFASLMPYKAGVRSTEAVTLANKSIRLMSKGLPLVVHGMPHFLKNKGIFSCATVQEVTVAINSCLKDFYKIQDGIEDFVSKNTENVRYEFFIKTLSGVN